MTSEVAPMDGGQQTLPPAAVVRPLTVIAADKQDVLAVEGRAAVLRLPKFSEDQIPRSAFARLPQRLSELEVAVGVRIPALLTFSERGQIHGMAEPGPLSFMLVAWVEGSTWQSAPAAELEHLLAGLAEYLRKASEQGLEILEDICHLDQYVWDGSTFWLTDLEPRYLCWCGEHAWVPKLYLHQVAQVIQSLLAAEAGRAPLEQARQAVDRLLEHLSCTDPEAAAEIRETWQRPGSDGNYYTARWLRGRP